MLKMMKLIVIVLSTPREVGVAAMSVSAQTPGRGVRAVRVPTAAMREPNS
jgi:hypothetical protein